MVHKNERKTRAQVAQQQQQRKKNPIIFILVKSVFENEYVYVYEEVGFYMHTAFNSICNVLLVYDMNHEKKRLHSIRTIRVRMRASKRRRERKH